MWDGAVGLPLTSEYKTQELKKNNLELFFCEPWGNTWALLNFSAVWRTHAFQPLALTDHSPWQLLI